MHQKKKVLTVREVPVNPIRRFQLPEKVCPVCGQTFLGTKKAKYDRVACRQKANYERYAEEYRQSKLKQYHQQKKKFPRSCQFSHI
jgi:hypothetical protein